MSTPSPSDVFIASLQLIQARIYFIGGPILIILGTISCLLSFIVFKKKLRNGPCTIYLLSYNLSNFLFIYASLFAAMLELGFNINPSAYNIACCRLRVYAMFLFDSLSSFYLILASIDQMCVTSPNDNLRRRSNNAFAYKCIIIGTLFWIIFNSHALILPNIVQIAPNRFTCYFKPGLYPVFIAYYSLIKSISMPSLMTLFGLFAVKNIRSIRPVNVIQDITNRKHTSHAPSFKDRKLINLVLMNIMVNALFAAAITTFLMYEQITQYQKKSDVQKQMDLLLRSIALFGLYTRSCICGYTNLFVSRAVRRQIKVVLLCRRNFAQN